MKNIIKNFFPALLAIFTAMSVCGQNDENQIIITHQVSGPGQTKPILISMNGISGEAAEVLQFDLYVQGFKFVSPDAAQYQISGSSGGNVSGTVTDTVAKRVILSRGYSGASLRDQAHAFANDIVMAITAKPGISLMRGSTARIAFKAQRPDQTGEIYVSDFDGHNPLAITHDNVIVARPAWMPDRLALYYTSYKLNNPDIFFHNLANGQRRVLAGFSGLNTSATVSPDGTKVAMILSKSGSPEVWTSDIDGAHFQQLTSIPDGASSPCWSPDGRWICFETKLNGRRMLAKVPSDGGSVVSMPTVGAPNPSEPDWSPDGKWIAFTSQTSEFDICVMAVDGSVPPTVLVRGADPSWAPNSRTLIYDRSVGYRGTLSVLDVMTNQHKDIGRVSGSDTEPAWAK
jgi:TolB protein